MAEMNAGKNCGACHNGEKAFKSSDAANCGKCHKK
jgi:c(7)-type cytochrome triheme protein